MKNSEFIEVESNVHLHIRDWGKGKTIVFIPGWPLSHEMYEYQFTHLVKQGYRCVGISLRGFGKSSAPWGDYNYDVFADDIKKVLETLNLKEITLAGHSMGGAISLHYLARHKHARVARLALFGAAAPCFTKRSGFPYGLEAAAVDEFIEACITDRPKLVDSFGKIFFHRENTVSPKMAEWFYSMGMEASPQATSACLKALRDADLREVLVKVSVPTTIFHSKHDQICPYQLGQALATGITGATLVPFEKSGHGLFFEEKDKFNTELAKFVG
ncbi:MAG TPA: alpha/beta hydrolase [Candidatus Riflebacteria bacterium]|jgi:pimeloyl-ACP methyl ester carboxylesterase|nr:alpha/beta hydrolase [Candidatus Riflebacteria bacterium]